MSQPTTTAPGGGPSVPLDQPTSQNPNPLLRMLTLPQGLEWLDPMNVLGRLRHPLADFAQSDLGKLFGMPGDIAQQIGVATGIIPNPQEGGPPQHLRAPQDQIDAVWQYARDMGFADQNGTINDTLVVGILNQLGAENPTLDVPGAMTAIQNQAKERDVRNILAGFDPQQAEFTGGLQKLIGETETGFEDVKQRGLEYFDPAIGRLDRILSGGTGALYSDPEAYNALNVTRSAGEDFVAEQTRQAAQRAAARGGGARGAEAGAITGGQEAAFKANRAAEQGLLGAAGGRRENLAGRRSEFLTDWQSGRTGALTPLQDLLRQSGQWGTEFRAGVQLDPSRYFDYSTPFWNLYGSKELQRTQAEERAAKLGNVVQTAISQGQDAFSNLPNMFTSFMPGRGR